MLEIETGVQNTPIKCVFYGSEGVGKSTLAAKMLNPLFIDMEGGTSRLNVRRIKCTSWEKLNAIVREVYEHPETCKTLIVDTVDWAEARCVEYVCSKYRKANIEEFGYGKGYTYLGEEFARFLGQFSKLTDVGINPVLIAHGKPRKYELPEEQGQFDRWEMKLSKQVCPLVKEWCDLLLFLNYKVVVVSTENNSKKAQGGKRVMYTNHHPTFDAKNRFDLPDELDLDYEPIRYLFETEPQSKPMSEKPEVKTMRESVVKLKAMLQEEGITAEDLQTLVAERRHLDKGVSLEEYSDDFITRWVMPNWTKIKETIKKTKNGGNE